MGDFGRVEGMVGMLAEVGAGCGIFLFPFLLNFLQTWNKSPTLCFVVSHCRNFPVRRWFHSVHLWLGGGIHIEVVRLSGASPHWAMYMKHVSYSWWFSLVFGSPLGFPCGTSGKEPACQRRRHKKQRFDPWVRKISWRRTWQLTPMSLPGESHEQRSLAVSMGSQRVGCNLRTKQQQNTI